MDFDSYLRHDATALAALVAQGEVTPQHLLDLALARHHAVHGRVNAVVRLMEDEARRQPQTNALPPLVPPPVTTADG